MRRALSLRPFFGKVFGRNAAEVRPQVGSKVDWTELYSKHRPVVAFDGKVPDISTDVFIAPNATLVGRVRIGPKSSIWYNAVLRGDVNNIRIGAFVNVQDRTVITVNKDSVSEYALGSTVIHNYVSIGHGCLLKSCIIEEESVIGAGSIIMEGAVVEKNVILEPGTLVEPDTRIPAGEVWGGNPAQFIRKCTYDDIHHIEDLANDVYELSTTHQDEFYLPYSTSYWELEQLRAPLK